METLKTLFTRQSVRSYKADQIPKDALETILKAACAAPVGNAKFGDMHLTVLQNRELMDKITACAAKAQGDPNAKPFYGAPTVIIVSAAMSAGLGATLSFANAACLVENMAIAATDLGLGSVYLLGFLAALNQDKILVSQLQLPEGFIPVSALAVGYPVIPLEERSVSLDKIGTNYIK